MSYESISNLGRNVVELFFIAFWCSSCVARAAECQPSTQGYEPVPPGFDFPADPERLVQWLGFDPFHPSNSSFGPMREGLLRLHVWRLFAGLNTPSRASKPGAMIPIWATWYRVPSEAVNCVTSRSLEPVPFEAPNQLIDPTTSPATLPAERNIGIVSHILYNLTTLQFILQNNLNRRWKLDELRPKEPDREPFLIDFPRSSIAIKTTWMRVAAKGCTAIPVWDSIPRDISVASNPPSTWLRHIGIVATEDGSSDCQGLHLVHLSAIYSHRVNQDEVKQIRLAAEVLGPEVSLPPYQRSDLALIQKDDYVVLVGFHFTTKEIPNWVWATFWWHDRPNAGPYSAGRPESVKGQWRNYLMDCSYDMDRPQLPDASPKVAFNPYLEGVLADGVRSNCMTCHRRSIWPPPFGHVRTLNVVGDSIQTVRQQIVVRGSEAAVASYLPEWGNALKLDFLWSLIRVAQDGPKP
jgi:hypothetical protein